MNFRPACLDTKENKREGGPKGPPWVSKIDRLIIVLIK